MKTLPARLTFSTQTVELLAKADGLKTGIITGANRSARQMDSGARKLAEPFVDNSIASVVRAAEAIQRLNNDLGTRIPTGN